MTLRPATLLAVVLLAAPAFGQKIAILPFTGPNGNAVRNQLVAAICEQADCVGQQKVNTNGRGDWKKAKKEKVKFIIEGKVVAKGKKKTIELEVFAKAGAPKLKKSYPLDASGDLSDKTLGAAFAAIGKVLGVKEEPEEKEKPAPEEKEKPAPEEKEKPAPEVKEKPAPEEKEKPAPEEKKKVTPPPPPPKAEPKEEPKEEEPAPAGPSHQTKPPVFSAEVGFDAASKSFSYSNVATPNLRSYSAPFIPSVAVKAELYPIALFSDGAAAGLGVEVGYVIAIGLKSSRKGSDVRYPTNISRLDVAAKFQWRPSSKSDANVGPFIGFRSHAFSVSPGSDSSTLDGLPAINYSAIKVGLSGELPFGDTGLLVFGRFAVLPVLSAPEIIGSKFFANGSVLGIDGGLGLGFKLPFLKLLSLRLAFDFARYGLSFRTAATDTYVAEGAVDQYLGGNLGVRFTY